PQGGGDCGGKSVTHRAAGRRELGRHWPVAPIAMPPAGEITRAVADDGVLGKLLTHRGNARAEVESHSVARLRLGPFEPFLVRLLARAEFHQIRVDPLV